MDDIEIYIKLSTLPDPLKKEIDDFVDFLKMKVVEKKSTKIRKAGLAKGLVEMKEDFDEPLEDFDCDFLIIALRGSSNRWPLCHFP